MPELLQRCSARELAEWMAYERLEPFGPPSAAYNAGIVASTLANIHRAKDRQPFRPEDFTPQIVHVPTPAERAAAERKRAATLSAKIRAWFTKGR